MEAFTGSPPPLPLGHVLSAERERLGLSRVDAAQRLHMSAWQVEALEAGDYTRLPKGTFLRGFVRNYARMLGLDAEAALTRLAQAAPHGPAPGIVVPSQNIRFDPLGERLDNPYVKAFGLATVAVLLAFAAIYWWIFIKPAPPAATLNPALSPGKKAEAPTLSRGRGVATQHPLPQNLAVAPVPPPEPVVTREAPKEEPKAEVAAVKSAGQAAEEKIRGQGPERPEKSAAPTPRGAKSLKFRFKGASWVEIRDRSGKVLASGLNAAGSESEVAGRPPLSVTVGNAPEVTMLYDGREFPLEPHTKVAVARFTLE